jgi:hypothetical protein
MMTAQTTLELHQCLITAVTRSESAFNVHSDDLRQASGSLARWLSQAELDRNDKSQQASEQLTMIAEMANEGRTRAAKAVDTIVEPKPLLEGALITDSRHGLLQARLNVQAALDGILGEGRALLLWQARRASIMTGLGIAALVFFVLVGLLIIREIYQQPSGPATATNEALTAQSNVSATFESQIVGTSTNVTGVNEEHTQTAEANKKDINVIDIPLATETMNATITVEALSTNVAGTHAVETAMAVLESTSTPSSQESQNNSSATCPGALPTRVSIGAMARVINYQLNVRSGPGTQNSIVRRLDVGRTMDILDGPVCDEGQLWYHIVSETIRPRDGSQPYQAEGWLVEESGGTYYLEPVP